MPFNHFVLTRSQLREDLMQAYLEARRHKRSRAYQIDFERNLESNLDSLCNDLFNRTYSPLPSDCFIITDPKKREIFAASFRDRIVHNLYYNYVHEMFERTFIADSYSCIKDRGTHYGIRRLRSHIQREIQNYREECFVLKMDVRGYFMHINRERLLGLCIDTLEKMSTHRVGRYRKERWCDVVDIGFVLYLTRQIVMLDCTASCNIRGRASDWYDLPSSKSLFCSPRGCGLPIGNLTSQLFSNVYLNVLDQYMKRCLGCRHYGRYVDDFFVVSTDRSWLRSLISTVREFLSKELGLELHMGKVRIDSVRMGVEFIGAFIKPCRTYVSRTTLNRIVPKLTKYLNVCRSNPLMPFELKTKIMNRLASYMGLFCHYRGSLSLFPQIFSLQES